MYNLLVTSRSGAWGETSHEFSPSRAIRSGEYTSGSLADRYGDFTETTIKEVMQFPCIFAYEIGAEGDAKFGWITDLRRTSSGGVQIKWRIERSVTPIPWDALRRLEWELDIADGELYRTHWAVKDVDLIEVLADNDLLDRNAITPPPDVTIPAGKVNTRTKFVMQIAPKVFEQPTQVVDSNLAAVMMPFNSSFDPVYMAIREACADAGFKCQRVDDIWDETTIIQDVFNLIYRSRLVVADLSNMNGNVMYEVGIAHTLGRDVVPIAQHDSDIPFDLRHHRYLKYLLNGEGLDSMKKTLSQKLERLSAADA